MHFKTTLALFFAAVAIASPVAEPAEQEAQSAQEGQEAEWPGRWGGGWGYPHGNGGWGWGARWCQRDWNSCVQNCNNGYSAFGGNYGCYNRCDSSHCSLRNSRFF